MKKIKLLFGLLIVTAFVAITVLSATSTDNTAVKRNCILPTHA